MTEYKIKLDSSRTILGVQYPKGIRGALLGILRGDPDLHVLHRLQATSTPHLLCVAQNRSSEGTKIPGSPEKPGVDFILLEHSKSLTLTMDCGKQRIEWI